MFLGYPLSDWYSFFYAVEAVAFYIIMVVIILLPSKTHPINKNRFIR